ncbi:Pou domain - to homeobox domain protein [Onchocerca flexuosa]|uniref:POU domain protein n=1 Tax=Onchocerca flexuosa TaxID=387005 RepID=A0A238BUY3_9BILA|nr:Pou domain - to homeobox domain protein [Onchocerca flexuosa]
MSNMFIEYTSRDNNSRNEPANVNAGKIEGISKNIENMANDVSTRGISSLQITACKRQEGGFKRGGAETLVTDTSDVEASTSTALSCSSISPKSLLDRRQPLVSKADNSTSRSSCKRKPALPKKRPSTMQEPVIISAETGEAVDDDAVLMEDSVCSSGNTAINRDCRFGPGSTDFCKGATDLQRLLSTTDKSVPANLCSITNAANILHCDSELLNGETKVERWETSSISSTSDALMIDTRSNSLSSLEDINEKQQDMESFVVTDAIDSVDSTERDMSSSKVVAEAVDIHNTENSPSQTDGSVDRINKYQQMTDAKNCKFSEQFMDQRNGSSISNLNDVLILNAAVNSFLWANAAAGTDGANAFITPEILASLSAAGLSPSLGVPCASSLTDKQYDNELLKTSLSSSSTTTSMKHELLINDAYSTDTPSADSLHLETVFGSAESIAPELVPEPAEFVDIHEALSPQYETLKPLIPLSHPSANKTVLPACETLLLNHSVELITKTSPSFSFDGMNLTIITMYHLWGGCDNNSCFPGRPFKLMSDFLTESQKYLIKNTHISFETISSSRNLYSLQLSDAKRQSNKAVKCKINDVKLNVKRRANEETLNNAARAITKEEKIDLDELENFAQTFKKQRIKFGFTQGDVGLALGRRYGTDFSQTTISRFEALNLSFKNMCKLRPLLKEWLEDAEAALANGATISDLLDAPSKEPAPQYATTVIHLPLNNNKPSSAVNIANSGNKMPSDDSPSPNGSIMCSSGASGGIPLKKRRKRTNLDLAQRSALDAYFDMNPRPDHDRMAEIAELVGLDRDVVRVWFCNRRQKLRKE